MVFGIVAAGLILPAQIGLLGAVYALAAKFAFATAHLAVMRLRFVEPDLYRPYEMPFNIPYGRASIPVLSIVGALAIGTVFTQLVFQNISNSTWVFLVWLVLGAAGFVWYRRRRKEPWWEPLEVPPPPHGEVARRPIEPHPTAARVLHGRREKVLAHAAPIPERRVRRRTRLLGVQLFFARHGYVRGALIVAGFAAVGGLPAGVPLSPYGPFRPGIGWSPGIVALALIPPH